MFSSSTKERPRRARLFLGREPRSSPSRRRSSRKSFLSRAGSSIDPEWLWRTTLSTARQALSRAGASEREPVIVAGARPSRARFYDRRARIIRIVFRCDPAIEHELIRPVAARAALPESLRAMPRATFSELHGAGMDG